MTHLHHLRLLLLALVLPFVSLKAQTSDEAIQRAIIHQMQSYPASTLKDLYKSFFQDAFGPGHLLNDDADAPQRMRRYLEQECQEARQESCECPYYEITGSLGRFYRVNLSLINDGRIPLDTFMSAFMRSAAMFSLPKINDWQQEWQRIEHIIHRLGYRLPDQETDSAAIQTLLGKGQYASHHSEAYVKAYHPHYRLIECSIFEHELMPLLRHYAPADTLADAATRSLLARLYQTVDEGHIFSGLHHNQLNMPNYRHDLDRIDRAVPGAVPMVWGGDLAWDADQVVRMAIDHHHKGHIISITWHAARPFDTGIVNFSKQTQGHFSAQQWQELVTEGSIMYTKWIAQVDSIALFLKQLQDNGVPVLWRPFHEMNGEWFWWGDRRGDNGFAVLWRMLYDRLTHHHQLHNLIWVWNPNNPRKHPVDKEMGYDLYYPGHDYVDVLAADVYHREWMQDTHDQLLTLGDNRLIALGEVGELPTSQQLANYNRYAWFMLWTSFSDDKYNTLV